MTNYRLTGRRGGRPAVRRARQLHRARLTDPAFRNSLWLTLLFVLRLGGHRPERARLRARLGDARRPQAGQGRRRDAGAAGVDPARLGRRVPVDRAARPRRRHASTTLLGTPGIAWLVEYPMVSIIIFNIWRGTAFSMLLYSAALGAVPPSQLETRPAGRRRPRWQQLRDVVFPHIRGHVLTNTLLITPVDVQRLHAVPAHRGRPEPRRRRSCRSTSTRRRIPGGELGYGAAISLIMLLINLVIALVYLRAARADGSSDDHGRDSHVDVDDATAAVPNVGHACAHFLVRVVFTVSCAASAFFALPLLWLVLAPFDATPTLTRARGRTGTLDNFARLVDNPYALRSLRQLGAARACGTMLHRRRARARSPPTRCPGSASRAATRCCTCCCCCPRSSPAPRRWCRSSC